MTAAKMMERLLYKWVPRDRCVAIMPIVYVHTGDEVPEGAVGTVRHVTRAGVVGVQWDQLATKVLDTSPDGLDPEVRS